MSNSQLTNPSRSTHRRLGALARFTLAVSLLTAPACADRGQVVAVPAPAADHDKPGTMTVSGLATLDVAPDCADLSMTLVATGARPGEATASVQRQQGVLIDALRLAGLDQADLKLSHLRVTQVRAETAQGVTTQRITGYRAEITVTATTKHFTLVGAILEAGANAGAAEISSQFRRSDLPALKKQVREQALAAAKEKAAQTASALGVGLGRIIAVSESPGGPMWGLGYFPQIPNASRVQAPGGEALGGELQTLQLEVTLGYELAKPDSSS